MRSECSKHPQTVHDSGGGRAHTRVRIGHGIRSGNSFRPGASARASVVLILENEKDAETRNAIRAALSDKEWSVRAAAVHALAIRNDPAMKEDFVPLFDDKKDAVRSRAAAGYVRLVLIEKP